MNAKNVFLGILSVIAVVGALAAGIWIIIASLPEKLETPERWTEHASATGQVSQVGQQGIAVRFADGRKGFYHGQSGYTNGQTVRVDADVSYIRRYNTARGAIEFTQISVQPLQDHDVSQNHP